MSNIEFNNTTFSTEQPQIVEGAIEEIKKHNAKKDSKKIVVQPEIKQETSVPLPKPEKDVTAEEIEKMAEMIDGLEDNLRKNSVFIQNGQQLAKANNDDIEKSYDFSGSLDALFNALIEIFKLTRESRKIVAEQRRTSQQLNISFLEAQAESLRRAADWAVGVAVLSSVVAVVSVGIGGFNVKNSINTIKKTNEASGKMESATSNIKKLQDDLANNPDFLPQNWQLPHQQNTARVNRQIAQKKVKDTQDRIPQYQKELEEAAAKSRTNDTMGYAASAASQALSGAVSSTGSAVQSQSQAEVKELEADSTETQITTEVAREKTTSDDQLLNDIATAFRTLAESLLQAFRQGTIYV